MDYSNPAQVPNCESGSARFDQVAPGAILVLAV
jgi:hypothetical protein